MANVEKLLCMGQAHGADPTRMLLPAAGTNPKLRLSWTDIHFGASFCTPAQRAILFIKVWPELVVGGNDLAQLTNHLWLRLIRFEARAGGPKQGDTLRDTRQAAIVRTVLAEYCDNRVCRTCYRNTKGKPGHIQAHIEGKGVVDVPCPRCNGMGWVRWSDNRRYRAIGGDRNAFTQRVTPGYEHVLHACTSLYRQGEEQFMGALFGPETGLMKETA